MTAHIRMTARFVQADPRFSGDAVARVLARALCPEVFALNDECRAAMAEGRT